MTKPIMVLLVLLVSPALGVSAEVPAEHDYAGLPVEFAAIEMEYTDLDTARHDYLDLSLDVNSEEEAAEEFMEINYVY